MPLKLFYGSDDEVDGYHVVEIESVADFAEPGEDTEVSDFVKGMRGIVLLNDDETEEEKHHGFVEVHVGYGVFEEDHGERCDVYEDHCRFPDIT